MALDTLSIVAVLLASFVPPALYLIWIRRAEVFNREPYGPVVIVFTYGATVAISIAFVAELILTTLLARETDFLTQVFYGKQVAVELEFFILLVIIAPVVEETLKATGVLVFYRRLSELENGLVYGAAVGLGFAATENVLYLSNAIIGGIEVFLVTMVARVFSSVLLHASSTAVSGYGLARFRLSRDQPRRAHWAVYLLAAMAMHGTFNLLAAVGQIFSVGSYISLALLVIAFFFAITAFRLLRRYIKALDRAFPTQEPAGRAGKRQ